MTGHRTRLLDGMTTRRAMSPLTAVRWVSHKDLPALPRLWPGTPAGNDVSPQRGSRSK